MTAFENELYFVANAGNGEQIWKSDGTAAGTVQVTAINPGAATAFDDLVVQGSTLYFFGDDAIHGPALWKSDGTAGGTSMIAATGTAIGGGGVGELTAAGGQLFRRDRSDQRLSGLAQRRHIRRDASGKNYRSGNHLPAYASAVADDHWQHCLLRRQ